MDYLTTLHPERDLGSGAFGIVRLCKHDIHYEVAAKFFLRGDFEREEEWRAACTRALGEAQSLRALEHHNVVRIHDLVRSPEGDEFVIVMEFCAGGSAGGISASNEVHLPTVKRIMRDAAIGLNYIHERGYLHRDVKPDNILLGSDGRAKVGDFGFVTDELVAGFARPYGTPFYAPPELLKMGRCSAQTDVYALGVSFLQLAHGDAWILPGGPGKFFKLSERGYPFLSNAGTFLPHIPTAWRTCLNRLMRVEVDRRCQSMGEAVNLISRLPNVEDWHCVVAEESVQWTLQRGSRNVRVRWDNHLRRGDAWRAWSEAADGTAARTLGKSASGASPKDNYRTLQRFFESRSP